MRALAEVKTDGLNWLWRFPNRLIGAGMNNRTSAGTAASINTTKTLCIQFHGDSYKSYTKGYSWSSL